MAVLFKVLRLNPSDPDPPSIRSRPEVVTTPSLIPPQVARKVAHLVSSNQCGAALNKLESLVKNEAPVDSHCPSVREALQVLHPPATVQDHLQEVQATIPCLKLKAEQIAEVLPKLPKGSSSGLSTWTFETVKAVLLEDEDLQDLAVKLFNLILAGKGGPSAIWNACLLIPLSKGKGGIRPIAVADTWMRLLALVTARSFAESAKSDLSPLQVSSGAEHIIHMCKAQAHQIMASPGSTEVIVQIDGKNAFNSIRRQFILDKILEDPAFSTLAHFFKWSYGTPSPLYDVDGLWFIDSATGVRQGDPLGPLFFALGLHSVLESLYRKFPDVNIHGYLDDITLTGDASEVALAFKHLDGLLLEVGIVVNGAKSQAFCNPDMTASLTESLGVVPVSSEGISVLGCPIGSDAYVRSEVTLILGKYSAILPLVLQFSAKISYQLLEQCISKRPTYILRSVCPWLVETPAMVFDNRISKAINAFIGQQISANKVPPSSLLELDNLPMLIERADSVRALPRSMGGLGIRKAVDLSRPAWTASLISSWHWISEKKPKLMGSPCSSLLSDQAYQLLLKDTFEATMGSKIETAAQLVDYYKSQGKIPTQRFLTQILVDEPNHKALLSLIAPLEPTLAYHLSEANEHSGCWLSAGLSSSPALSLTDPVFIENVGLRLLIHPLDVDPQVSLRCPCDKSRFLQPDLDTYHCFSCMGKNGPSTCFHSRHGGVIGCLVDFVCAACPNAQAFREPNMPQVVKPLRADVRLDQGNISYFFDVSIVNPAARAYIKAVQPHKNPLAAAALMERTKSSKYKASYNEQNGYKVLGESVIPFVLETTGAFGNSALAVISKLAGFKDLVPTPNESLAKARRWFMQRVSVILARSRYELLGHFRRRVIRTEFHQSDLDYSSSVDGYVSSQSDWEGQALS